MKHTAEKVRVVVSTEQIRLRVAELARQISADYQGRTLCAIGVLEDGFIFMADLVRQLDVPVLCQFVKPENKELWHGRTGTEEIFFSPEVKVEKADVLLVLGLVQSGVTSEFLMRNLLARGARSVKLATLLDRATARRVGLHPDYVAFPIEEGYVFGYGLGAPELKRNLPYVATMAQAGARAGRGK